MTLRPQEAAFSDGSAGVGSSSESSSDSGSEDSESATSESSEPVYTLRARRAATEINYRVTQFDELIDDAIRVSVGYGMNAILYLARP